MLATPGPPPTGPGWSVEFKWDGIRAIVDVAPDGQVRIWSRNGNDVTAAYPELVAERVPGGGWWGGWRGASRCSLTA